MSLLFVLSTLAFAEPLELNDAFAEAAHEFDVPQPLLWALAYEASRYDPEAQSAWGGRGLFDFREQGVEGPGLEAAAWALGCEPEDVLANPHSQVRAAAALLAKQRHLAGGGGAWEIEDWAPTVRAFSGSHDPERQRRFAQYIYEILWEGLGQPEPLPIDFERTGLEREAPPWLPQGDYYGNDDYVQAGYTNYTDASRSAGDIDYIVIHTTQGSYSGAISWFQNTTHEGVGSQVSAHYVVRSSDGAVTQCLLEEDIGWHAGNWEYNEHSVGIEHEGYVEEPETWYTEALYQGSAELSRDIISRNNITVDRSHIVAHSEVPGATHTDPGSGWDWNYYMALLSGEGVEEASLMGFVAVEDIYNGTRLAGVEVQLDNPSLTTTTDEDGYFHFDELGSGVYTVTANVNGYTSESCTQEITSSEGGWWCSIAIFPEGADTGDTGAGEERPEQPPREEEKSGCGCTGAPPVQALWWLAAGLAVRRRRRC